jgi:hypothetical protein
MKVWIGRQDQWQEGAQFIEEYDVIVMPRTDGGFNSWMSWHSGMFEGLPAVMQDELVIWDEMPGRCWSAAESERSCKRQQDILRAEMAKDQGCLAVTDEIKV